MRVLLVEDDPLLGDGLCTGLRQAGCTVDWVQDGHAAATALCADTFAVAVLDLGLPGRSGLEVLQEWRRCGYRTPVLILTACDDVSSRVTGLDSGADDYLVKPFDLDELCARLRALHRRNAGRATPLLVHGELVLDPAARSVTLRGEPVSLSTTEFGVLERLLSSTGRVLSKAQLEQAVYGWSGELESNAIEVHVHHLRRKLGSDLIRTVRGVGYCVDRSP